MRLGRVIGVAVRRLAKNDDVSPRTKVLRDIESRVGDEFLDWMDDLYDGPGDEQHKQDHLADEESRHDHLNDFLGETHDINVRPDGLVEFGRGGGEVEHVIGDNPIVLWHHTSDKLDKKIRQQGLTVGKKAANPYQNSRAGVYLTTERSGPAVSGYLDNAVQTHGGGGKTWGVKTSFDEISPDPDDEDIRSGASQYVVSHVPPDRLIEE